MSTALDSTALSSAKHFVIKYGAPIMALFILATAQGCSVTRTKVDPLTGERGPEETLFEIPTPKLSSQINKGTNAIHDSRQEYPTTYGERLPPAEYANTIEAAQYRTTVYPPTSFDPNLRLRVVAKEKFIRMDGAEKPLDWLIKYDTQNKQCQIFTTMLFGYNYYEVDATFNLVGNKSIELSSVQAKNLEGRDAGYINDSITEILSQQRAGISRGRNDLAELIDRANIGMHELKKWEQRQKRGANYGPMQTVVSPEPGSFRTGWQGITHESQIHVKQGYNADDITVDTAYHIKNIPQGRALRLELRAGPAREPGGDFSKFVNDSMAEAARSNDNSFKNLSFKEREPVFETEMALLLLDLDIRTTPDESNAPNITGIFRYDGYPTVDAREYFDRIRDKLYFKNNQGEITPIKDSYTLSREQLAQALEVRLADQYAQYAPGMFRTAGINAAAPRTNTSSATPRSGRNPYSQETLLRKAASGEIGIDMYTPTSGTSARGSKKVLEL